MKVRSIEVEPQLVREAELQDFSDAGLHVIYSHAGDAEQVQRSFKEASKVHLV